MNEQRNTTFWIIFVLCVIGIIPSLIIVLYTYIGSCDITPFFFPQGSQYHECSESAWNTLRAVYDMVIAIYPGFIIGLGTLIAALIKKRKNPAIALGILLVVYLWLLFDLFSRATG